MNDPKARYEIQCQRENNHHGRILTEIMHHLKTTLSNGSAVNISYGFEACPDLTHYPDLHVSVDENEFGISVITNVTPENDEMTGALIRKRRQYFKKKNYPVYWIVENRIPSPDKLHQGIVLWRTEAETGNKTGEDRLWELHLNGVIRDEGFFRLYDFPVKTAHELVDVRSLCQIRYSEESFFIRVYRYLKEGMARPIRPFHLTSGRELPLTEAVHIREGQLEFGDPKEEEQNRQQFFEDYQVRLNRAEDRKR